MSQDMLSFSEGLSFQSQEQIRILFGCQDQFLRQIRDCLGIQVVIRGDELWLSGDSDQVECGRRVFTDLKQIVEKYEELSVSDVEAALRRHGKGAAPEDASQDRQAWENGETSRHSNMPPQSPGQVTSSTSARHDSGTRNQNTSGLMPGDGVDSPEIDLFEKARSVKPRTEGQANYINAIRRNDLVICCGPAGCGKTYLAVAMALNALRTELVRKIVLVRPAVEAGEKLGFLPGDLLAKVNPYLRPLLDALADIVTFDQVKRYMENDIIEIVPLAYMRGRTLNDTFIILDEAQNTTSTQMKMFLTRMGENSRIVVTGDPTQDDLPSHIRSGLMDATRRLKGIPGVEAVELSGQDIVRHQLVRDIVRAYDDSPMPESSGRGRKGKPRR